MVWWYVVAWVVAFAISYALTPKPQQQRVSASKDVQAPTAEVGGEIGVLFGTRRIKSSNCVWYGDLRTVAIKKKGGKK